jgi:hypothetical protein
VRSTLEDVRSMEGLERIFGKRSSDCLGVPNALFNWHDYASLRIEVVVFEARHDVDVIVPDVWLPSRLIVLSS